MEFINDHFNDDFYYSAIGPASANGFATLGCIIVWKLKD